MNPPAVSSSEPDSAANTTSSEAGSTSTMTSSSVVRLSRSKQTWTGAGSAAGFVLRYLPPMKRLLVDVLGNEKDAERALAILISHLVKAGYSGHDQGRLRDFLILGLRSAAKARATEVETQAKQESSSNAEIQLNLEIAKTESKHWLRYWRDGLMDRTWRALERVQHADRIRLVRAGHEPVSDTSESVNEPNQDLVHDVLRIVTDHSGESSEVIAGRVAELAERQVTAEEVKRQLPLARALFAQLLADEIMLTLENADAAAIQEEIQRLGLKKAFAGLRVKS
ncbi:hypothetical protein [Rhodopirellula halodulae]|uniref:hypothetical protein n=1 Tax=Rhodopirellula halodulae TaxID=2894198 RepID=UPI002103CF4B